MVKAVGEGSNNIGREEETIDWKEDIRERSRRIYEWDKICLLYTSPSPRDKRQSRMPSSA